MILNDAADIRLGGDTVEAVYLGEDKVWPSGGDYTPIDWIQATGTQFIDTGYAQQGNSVKIVADAEITGGGDNAALVCGSNVGVTITWLSTSYQYRYNVLINMSAYLKSNSSHDPYGAGTRILVEANVNPSAVTITENSVNQGSKPGQSAAANGIPYCIFAYRQDAQSAPSMFIGAKLYSCKIYDNGTIVRDIMPMIRNSDGKPGLWDSVTQTFFTNAGTGEFVVPT